MKERTLANVPSAMSTSKERDLFAESSTLTSMPQLT
jgi:hypothetical protein